MAIKDKEKSITAEAFLPDVLSLNNLKKAAKRCRGCPLYKNATQTVFGEGSRNAKLMLVGEIPGDKEDVLGKPFVGPAGVFLRRSIQDLGITDDDVYYTNVVKHFKFTYSYKRRLHRSPTGQEIHACKPWLLAEIEVIKPKAIVCLGATAAKSLILKNFQITKQHGQWFTTDEGISIIATYHPSAILRAPDHDARQLMKKTFAQDMKKVATYLQLGGIQA